MIRLQCPHCAILNDVPDDASEAVCHRCRGKFFTAPAPPPVVHNARGAIPGVAALLSFFLPGLGQIYNGNIAIGLLLMILYPVSGVLAWVAFIAAMKTEPIYGIAIVVPLLVWLAGIFDAHRTAAASQDAYRQ